MTIDEILDSKGLRSMIEKYRTRCFWNMAKDFMPRTKEQVVLALKRLEQHGDLVAYRYAGVAKTWL